jgi:hypothetical protein
VVLGELETSMSPDEWHAEGHPHSHTLVKLFNIEGEALAAVCVDVGMDVSALGQGGVAGS